MFMLLKKFSESIRAITNKTIGEMCMNAHILLVSKWNSKHN